MGDNLPAVDLGPGRVPANVSAGMYHTCVLLTSGEVVCWGENEFGQLGVGDTAKRGHAPGTMVSRPPVISSLVVCPACVAAAVYADVVCMCLSCAAVLCAALFMYLLYLRTQLAGFKPDSREPWQRLGCHRYQHRM